MRLSYVMSGVATGMRRNLSMTIALILNTAIALAFVSSAILANKEIGNFSRDYENKLNVSIYLCGSVTSPKCPKTVTDAQRGALQKQLQSDPHIKSVSFVSEDEAYRRAKEILDPAVGPFIQKGWAPSSFTIKLKDISRDYNAVANKYANVAGVDTVRNQDESFKRLLSMIDGVRVLSLVVALIVLVASVLLMANTIQVAAAQRRAETSIMRLVGASRWMTQLPFVIEALISTVIGGVIAFVFITIGKHYVLGGIFKQQVADQVIPNLSFGDLIFASLIGLVLGAVLSVATAWTTLRMYVRL